VQFWRALNFEGHLYIVFFRYENEGDKERRDKGWRRSRVVKKEIGQGAENEIKEKMENGLEIEIEEEMHSIFKPFSFNFNFQALYRIRPEKAQGYARNASAKASAKRTIPTELKSNGMDLCFIMVIIKQLMLS